MFYQHAPVGNPIQFNFEPAQDISEFFSPYSTHFYDSGTASLAAAIAAARTHRPTARPEVIVPAYGCPDIISAVLHVGAKPVLVDLEANRPWMNLQLLKNRLNEHTIAIVAASFLGISERLTELRELAEHAGIVLIEDSAQAFPHGQQTDFWQGDLVVLSFGRGKPVSLLGGGAVLCRDPALQKLLPVVATDSQVSALQQYRYRLKVALYNTVLSPRVYWALLAMPFLHIGETHFKPLSTIAAIDAVRLSQLGGNITYYQQASLHAQSSLAEYVSGDSEDEAQLIDLAKVCAVTPQQRLLRYPLLVPAQKRPALLAEFARLGLGATCMYPVVMTEIPGLEQAFTGQGDFPVARSFANRVLTLPTHQQLGTENLVNIRNVLSSV